MDSSTLAAWWGAITGSLALAWEMFRWHQSGPKLLVAASPNMQVVRPGLGVDEEIFISVSVRNVGDAATTITHFMGVTYAGWFNHLRRKRAGLFIVTTGSDSPLPHRLEPGATWSGTVKQKEALLALKKKGDMLYIGVKHSMHEKPVLVRVPIANEG